MKNNNSPGMPIPPFFYESSDGSIHVGTNQGPCPSIEKLKKMRQALEEIINEGQEQIDIYNIEMDKALEERYISDGNILKKPSDTEGFIYLIKSGPYYKIGRTKNKSRIREYRTENPNKIEVIIWKKVPFYIAGELHLLKEYEQYKYRGEWFKFTKVQVDEIKKLLK